MTDESRPGGAPPGWKDLSAESGDIEAAQQLLAQARAVPWSAVSKARVRSRLEREHRPPRLPRVLVTAALVCVASVASAKLYREGFRPKATSVEPEQTEPTSGRATKNGQEPSFDLEAASALRMALDHLDSGRFDEVLVLAESHANGPLGPEFGLVRVRALVALNRLEHALEFLQSARLAGSPRRLELILLRAELAARLGRCTSARSDRDVVLQETNDNSFVSRARAVCREEAR